MNRFIGYIQVACCCLLLCASCVRDGMDEDCNSYVRFVYDYNLEYIDLFHKQATKMNLYVFDEKGFADYMKYMKKNKVKDAKKIEISTRMYLAECTQDWKKYISLQTN